MALHRRVASLLLTLAGIGLAGPAGAEPPCAPPSAPPAATPAHPPIVLAVSGPRRGDVEIHELERAIGEELGAPVVPASTEPAPAGAARLELVLTDQRLLVRHTSPDGRVLERSVDRPADGDALIEVVAWLAGNLGRNEAGELIDELTAQPGGGGALPGGDAAPDAASDGGGDAASNAHASAHAEGEPTSAKAGGLTPKSAQENAALAPIPSTHEAERTLGPPLLGTPVQLTLAHPIALYPDAAHRRFSFEVGLFYSRLGAVRGAGFNAIAHRIDHGLEGVQLSGVWAHQNGEMDGIRFAGVVTSGASIDATGATIAGLVDLQAGEGQYSGLRFAGLVTAHNGKSDGVIIGGMGNVLGAADGLAIGGLFNLTGRREQDELRGLAIAGAFNGARNADAVMVAGAGNVGADVDGLQVSGGFNGARRLRGAQIGLLNVAERVEGTQIGLVNIAREVEGAAIAPINIVEKARIQALVFASSAAPLSTGIRFVVAPLVTTTSIGYDPLGDSDRLIPQVAIGGRIPFEPLYADLEAGYAPEIEPKKHPAEGPVQTVRFRGSIGWDVLPPIGIFAAGGVRYAIDPSDLGPEFLGGITVL
jgi:hypothetical protein